MRFSFIVMSRDTIQLAVSLRSDGSLYGGLNALKDLTYATPSPPPPLLKLPQNKPTYT